MTDAKEDVVDACRSHGGDRLRDVWVFDETGEEAIFLRTDLEEKLDGLDVEQFIDAERYGYVERDIYEALYYTDYEFTLRGMEGFDQFRTFLGERSDRIGLMLSFDTNGDIDYRSLTDDLRSIYEQHGAEALSPTE